MSSSPQIEVTPEERERRLRALPLREAEVHIVEWVKALDLAQLQHGRNAALRYEEMNARLEFLGKTAASSEEELKALRRDVSDLKATSGELSEGMGALIRHHEDSVRTDAEQTANLKAQADQLVEVKSKLTAINVLKWTVGGGTFLGVMAVVQRVVEWLLKAMLGG